MQKEFNPNEYVDLFFKELKTYNNTNFRTLLRARLANDDAIVHKSFSSVVTRFFIFCEKHPEMSKTDINVLYFKLKIDMIAKYFSEYPDKSLEQLQSFQNELRAYVERTRNV